jgi:hypothetical protein
MHVLDLSRAWDPSQIAAYKPVLAALSFRGGTKKSHSEQQLPAALMGRPNKEGSATGKGAALYYVEPPTMALHLCFNEVGPVVPLLWEGSNIDKVFTHLRVASP